MSLRIPRNFMGSTSLRRLKKAAGMWTDPREDVKPIIARRNEFLVLRVHNQQFSVQFVFPEIAELFNVVVVCFSLPGQSNLQFMAIDGLFSIPDLILIRQQ